LEGAARSDGRDQTFAQKGWQGVDMKAHLAVVEQMFVFAKKHLKPDSWLLLHLEKEIHLLKLLVRDRK